MHIYTHRCQKQYKHTHTHRFLSPALPDDEDYEDDTHTHRPCATAAGVARSSPAPHGTRGVGGGSANPAHRQELSVEGGGEGREASGGLAMLKNSWSIISQDLSQDLSSLRRKGRGGGPGGAGGGKPGKWGLFGGGGDSDEDD